MPAMMEEDTKARLTMDKPARRRYPLYFPRLEFNRVGDIALPSESLIWLLPETTTRSNLIHLLFTDRFRTLLGSDWHQVAVRVVAYFSKISANPLDSSDDYRLRCHLLSNFPTDSAGNACAEFDAIWDEAHRSTPQLVTRHNLRKSFELIEHIDLPLPQHKHCTLGFQCLVRQINHCAYSCLWIPDESQRAIFKEAFIQYLFRDECDILPKVPSQGRKGGRYVNTSIENKDIGSISDEEVLARSAKIYGASIGVFRSWIARGKSMTVAEANGKRFVSVEQRAFDEDIDTQQAKLPIWFSKKTGLALVPVWALACRYRKSTDVIQDWIRKGRVYAESTGNEFLASLTQADVENSKPRHPGGRPPTKPIKF